MPTTPVGNILHRIVAATVASSALAGCNTISVDGFEPLECTGTQTAQLLGDLQLINAPDYMELWRRESVDPGADAELEDSMGTPCGNAADPAACQAAIERAASTAGGFRMDQCVQICSEYFLIVNRSDQVEVITSADGMRALLAEIDTPVEAAMIARMAEYYVACGDVKRGGVKPSADGYEVIATRLTADCDPVESTRYRLAVSRDGSLRELESEIYESTSGACVGRRPRCMRERRGRGATKLGAYFASVAHLEDLAVHAFAELRGELARFGAPADLLERAEEARRDEVRHTRLMRKLASRFGGQAPRAVAMKRPERTPHHPGGTAALERFALHNAVEGCVRETFGALVGIWQARFAADEQVKRAMRRVAVDETRHAALSWDIDRWVRRKLGVEANRRIDRGRERALGELEREADQPIDRELVRWAGLPARREHVRLARRFALELGAA
jgi:hypothetical protein